jgi:hypothetical protein
MTSRTKHFVFIGLALSLMMTLAGFQTSVLADDDDDCCCPRPIMVQPVCCPAPAPVISCPAPAPVISCPAPAPVISCPAPVFSCPVPTAGFSYPYDYPDRRRYRLGRRPWANDWDD